MRQSEVCNPAPALETIAWINSEKPLLLSDLKGKVIVIHAFQMLCPACVVHSVPQARAIYDYYARKDVEVIGLHSVFEHHDVMTFDALKAFAAEYRIPYPIAVDKPSEHSPVPKTMTSYQMRGTPTLIILDKTGEIKLNHFGQMNDMQVGSIIGGLLAEKSDLLISVENNEPPKSTNSGECEGDTCSI